MNMWTARRAYQAGSRVIRAIGRSSISHPSIIPAHSASRPTCPDHAHFVAAFHSSACRATIPPPVVLMPPSTTTSTIPSVNVPSCKRTLLPDEEPFQSHSSSTPYIPIRPFDLTFLGTASSRPTPTRGVSSLAVRLGRKKSILLFDCGDGTQSRWIQARYLTFERLSVICITHMHGDHVFGLPNLVAGACTKKVAEPLHIFGPIGIANYVRANLNATHTWLERPIVFHELLKKNTKTRTLTPQPDVLYHQNPDFSQPTMQVHEDDDFIIHAGPLRHRDLNCWGYVVTEKLESRDSVHQPRKLVVLGDTSDSTSLTEVAKGANVVVHEATFLDDDMQKAYMTGHSTAGMAGTFAQSVASDHLILTHFANRYIKSESDTTGKINTSELDQHRQQAMTTANHDRVHLAQDWQRFYIHPKEHQHQQSQPMESVASINQSTTLAPSSTPISPSSTQTHNPKSSSNLSSPSHSSHSPQRNRPVERSTPKAQPRWSSTSQPPSASTNPSSSPTPPISVPSPPSSPSSPPPPPPPPPLYVAMPKKPPTRS